MALVTCTRCGRTAEGLPFPPYPDDMGARIQRSVCATCWREYMGRQTMVINEYRLDLMDPRAQEILTRDMIEFLGLESVNGGAEGREEGAG
jgi:Fe-S cluster biosynthesis and repair protein YggX